jgi:hypothetical protein
MAKAPAKTTDPLAHIPAWQCGAAGGAAASLGQFIGTTLLDTLGRFTNGDYRGVIIQMISFVIATGLIAFAGAVVAYFFQSKTQNRWALFLAGAAATSIGTTALPVFQKLMLRADIAPISVAYAQTSPTACNEPSISVWGGLKQFFRLDDAGWRVVVNSYPTFGEAEDEAHKLNLVDPSLHAVPGERAPCNKNYPVIVGPASSTLAEAKELQAKILSMNNPALAGAYVSKRNF